MTAAEQTAARPPVPVAKIVFDAFLVLLIGTLVVSALTIKPMAALVPLIIGVPTLGALVVRLVLDILRRGKDYRPEPAAEEHEISAEHMAEASISELTRAARAEVDEDSKVTSDEAKRQNVFALWGIGYTVVSTVMTIYILPLPGLHTWFVPVALVALVVILRIIKLAWWKAIVIAIGITAVMYLMLVPFLGVRL